MGGRPFKSGRGYHPDPKPSERTREHCLVSPDDRFLLFVSYSCRDSEHPFLRALRTFFDRPEAKRVATCFMAEDVPDYGSDFVAKVLAALGTADVVLPFITEASQSSSWVNQEIGYALARGIPVLPAFDPSAVKGLQGMIQTTDACPVNNTARVQALFDRVLALASKDPATRKRGLSVEVKGRWWSEFKRAFPMYLRVHVRHTSKEPDSVERVFLECPNRVVEMESVDLPKLAELRIADFKDVVLKFFPNGPGGAQTEHMRLVIQTVRGNVAVAEFDASGPSGWQPSNLWDNFAPY